MTKRTLNLYGYVRVSRVNGREGDSFISPTVQRERITAYARSQGYTVNFLPDELDQSGGKADRPIFMQRLSAPSVASRTASSSRSSTDSAAARSTRRARSSASKLPARRRRARSSAKLRTWMAHDVLPRRRRERLARTPRAAP
jgi:hypothetical protein